MNADRAPKAAYAWKLASSDQVVDRLSVDTQHLRQLVDGEDCALQILVRIVSQRIGCTDGVRWTRIQGASERRVPPKDGPPHECLRSRLAHSCAASLWPGGGCGLCLPVRFDVFEFIGADEPAAYGSNPACACPREFGEPARGKAAGRRRGRLSAHRSDRCGIHGHRAARARWRINRLAAGRLIPGGSGFPKKKKQGRGVRRRQVARRSTSSDRLERRFCARALGWGLGASTSRKESSTRVGRSFDRRDVFETLGSRPRLPLQRESRTRPRKAPTTRLAHPAVSAQTACPTDDADRSL